MTDIHCFNEILEGDDMLKKVFQKFAVIIVVGLLAFVYYLLITPLSLIIRFKSNRLELHGQPNWHLYRRSGESVQMFAKREY